MVTNYQLTNVLNLNLPCANKSKLLIFHVNMHGINTNLLRLTEFLLLVKAKISIIVLTETELSDGRVNLFQV